jgi:hypothetical protein
MNDGKSAVAAAISHDTFSSSTSITMPLSRSTVSASPTAAVRSGGGITLQQNESKLPPKVVRGFGSFKSESVQVMIERSLDEYKIPALPFDIAAPLSPSVRDGFNKYATTTTPILPSHFAEFLKSELFYLDPSWTFVNHGAFGASFKPAVAAARKWLIHMVLPLKQPSIIESAGVAMIQSSLVDNGVINHRSVNHYDFLIVIYSH